MGTLKEQFGGVNVIIVDQYKYLTFCSLYGITRMYIDVGLLEKCATFWTTLYLARFRDVVTFPVYVTVYDLRQSFTFDKMFKSKDKQIIYIAV